MTTATLTRDEQIQALRDAEEQRRREFEAETVAVCFKDGSGSATIADLREAFDRFHTGRHWKDPHAAMVPESARLVTVAAIEWFQGSEPLVSARHENVDGSVEYSIHARGYVG